MSQTTAVPQPAGTGTLRVNPSLLVEGYLSVPHEGDNRRTKLNLAHYPDVAAWLLSMLDYILYKQGHLPGPRFIAEPPGGVTRQLLIDGRVILTSTRPDGGLALSLNPEFDVRLLLYTRRKGLRAHNHLMGLAEDPDLTRWLLMHSMGQPLPDPATLPAAFVARLQAHGVLVEEPPPEEATYPDPAEPVDLAADLAPMTRLFFQPAGTDLPGEVQERLGRHVPRLPAGTGLVWGEDAGTGMVYPSCWNGTPGPAALEALAGRDRVARAELWAQQRQAARHELRTRRYAVLRQILPPAHREHLRHFVREMVARGYFPQLGDGQVQLRAAIHNQPTIASLHKGLADIVNSICDERVLASYCYLACYEEGAVLERHKDRPQCAYNLSLVLDMWSAQGEPEPWPIYVEINDKPEAVLMRPGDGVAYSGTEIWHWRDALPKGQRAIVCFFHFVPEGFTGSLD